MMTCPLCFKNSCNCAELLRPFWPQENPAHRALPKLFLVRDEPEAKWPANDEQPARCDGAQAAEAGRKRLGGV
jgi:hypothetical protein